MLVWATLTGAVHLQMDAADGVDEREKAALVAELSSLIGAITGEPPNGDQLTRVGVKVRRVSWRMQVSLERRDGTLVTGREELDLTRDPRSWRAPLADALRRLLPEGRELASRKTKPPPSSVPITSPAPVVVADPVLPPSQLAAPAAAAARAEPDRPNFPILPFLAVAAGVGTTIAGVKFVNAASDAIDNVPTTLDPDAIEDQQRELLTNAVIGSVLLSTGIAIAVTGIVLFIDDVTD